MRQIKRRKAPFQWTNERLRYVMDAWEGHTAQQIADAIGCDAQAISYVAGMLRKAGLDLPTKRVKGRLNTLISEFVASLNK